MEYSSLCEGIEVNPENDYGEPGSGHKKWPGSKLPGQSGEGMMPSGRRQVFGLGFTWFVSPGQTLGTPPYRFLSDLGPRPLLLL